MDSIAEREELRVPGAALADRPSDRDAHSEAEADSEESVDAE